MQEFVPKADQFIIMGLVTVNGKLVTEMGFQVKRSDEVHDGQIVKNSPPVYILLNPKGFRLQSKVEI